MNDNRTTELMPCPFCGGRQTYRKHDGGVWLTTTNHKRGCIMRDALSFVAFATEAEAIAAWNTRAERMCELTDNGTWGYPYVCSACDASFDADVNNGDFNYCPNCGAKVVGE